MILLQFPFIDATLKGRHEKAELSVSYPVPEMDLSLHSGFPCAGVTPL